MILFTFDLTTGLAKLASTTTIKQGAEIPMQVQFVDNNVPVAPGTVNSIQVALGTDATPPAILAYLDTFSQVNDTTWSGVLDGTDSRLASFMSGKGSTTVNAELAVMIDGVDQVAPNVSISVQPPIIAGSETTLSTPTFYTSGQVDSLLATEVTNRNTAIANATLGLSPAANQSDLTPSAAVTTSLFTATEFSQLARKIVPGAGSGAFTAAYTLPTASMATGAIAEVNVELPASANPTIEIHDGGGTLLTSVTNPAPTAAAYWYGRFRFDGTAWHALFRAFQS